MLMAIVSWSWSSTLAEFMLKPGVTIGEAMPQVLLGVLDPALSSGGARRWD